MDETQQLKKSMSAIETRLALTERCSSEHSLELEKLARLLRGNGERGLFAQLELLSERVDVLQAQWRWVVGVLTALAVGVAQTLIRK